MAAAPRIAQLKPFRFDRTKGKWVHEARLPKLGAASASGTCKILTYNVWFETRAWWEARKRELFRLCQESEADFIALQEVLPEFLFDLLAEEWVREHYSVSDIDGTTIERYGVVLLARPRAAALAIAVLPTRMGRKLVFGVYEAGAGTRLAVGTMHFESLDSAPLRRTQLELCARILSESADAVLLVGDFNFCSLRNFRPGGKLENDCIAEVAPEFCDVWAVLRPDEPGYTFDSEANPMIGQFERMRYDRVLARGRALAPLAIEIVGNEVVACEGAHRGIMPSDHFGLVALFGLASD
eukprot:a509413_144.p1 GENE.a509413_144~~a509413_144.p1  ORF type:complete len:310 (-),score=87.81 a509413_144:227-1117(-)